MYIMEKANEVIGQITAFTSVSLMDLIGSAFMRLVTFFVNLLLGL